MFGIKKDESNPTPGSSGSENNMPLPPPIQDEVYVMPDQFHPQQSKKSSNKPLVISLIVLVLVIMASVTYFFYDMWQKNNNQPAVVNNNINNENENINQEAINDNANSLSLNASSTEELATSTENLVATTTDSVVPEPQISTSTPPQLSSDSDNDGLTDAEESVVETSPIKQDSDGDGFFDGIEILNGYSPLVPSSDSKSKLDQAAFLAVLNTNFAQNNFATLNIKDWPATLVPATNQALITTNTGEIIKISVKENPQKLSAANWYLSVNPQVALSQLKSISAGQLGGVFSVNGLEAYLTDAERNKIYSFEYIMDASAPFRYPSIFTMMIKNFKLVAGNKMPTVNGTTTPMAN